MWIVSLNVDGNNVSGIEVRCEMSGWCMTRAWTAASWVCWQQFVISSCFLSRNNPSAFLGLYTFDIPKWLSLQGWYSDPTADGSVDQASENTVSGWGNDMREIAKSKIRARYDCQHISQRNLWRSWDRLWDLMLFVVDSSMHAGSPYREINRCNKNTKPWARLMCS